MVVAWVLIDNRIRSSEYSIPRQVSLLHQFVLYMGIFFMLMFLPHLSLNFAPTMFPVLMAWGYTIGHIFMYIGFLCIGRLFFSIMPRIAKAEKTFFTIGLIATGIATIINAVTMVWGTRPGFDYEQNVTLLNAHPIVGATIGLFALVCVVPMSILLIRNSFISTNGRVRSLLLGIGLLLMMIGGPMHDVARTSMMYIIADVITTLALVITAIGIAYKMHDRITVSRTAPLASATN